MQNSYWIQKTSLTRTDRLPLSQVETKTQEVILWLSLVASMSLLIGGALFLVLPAESLIAYTGHWGSRILHGLFAGLGLGTFLLALSALFLGQYLIRRTPQPADILRYYPKIFLQIAVQISLVIMISSFLSVFESYYQLKSHALLIQFGIGGLTGHFLGGNLFTLFGLLGALSILGSVLVLIGIGSGKLELVNMALFIGELFKISATKSLSYGSRYTRQSLRHLSSGAKLIVRQNAATAKLAEKVGIDSTTVELPDTVANDDKNDLATIGNKKAINSVSGETPVGLELNPSMKSKTIQKQGMENGSGTEAKEEADPSATEKPQSKRRGRKKKVESTSEPVETKTNTPGEVQESKKEQENFIEVKSWKGRYQKPDTHLLQTSRKAKGMTREELKRACENLEQRLASFQITGKVIDAHVGPSLTMYEFLPDAGVKLSKISGLTNDLALVLGANSIRVLAPIPGKTTVGIEVPNKQPNMVTFSELLPTIRKAAKDQALPIAMGQDVYGNVVVEDIAKMPHLLISGTTGSGKSVFINSLITSLLYNRSPKELRFLMVDPKMIELSPYNGIPHLLKPVVTDVEEAKNVLVWAEKEMDRRYEIFSASQSRNIESFNSSIKKGSKASLERRIGKKIDWEWAEMPYIVVVVDELADLMITQGKDVEIPITRIAQKARSAGIHLVIATQRPSAEIVTGLIKTNFPTRMAFKVSSSVDSRTILDLSGAEKLLGNGDSLFMTNGKALERLQGSFISEDEVKKLVSNISDVKSKKK